MFAFMTKIWSREFLKSTVMILGLNTENYKKWNNLKLGLLYDSVQEGEKQWVFKLFGWGLNSFLQD